MSIFSLPFNIDGIEIVLFIAIALVFLFLKRFKVKRWPLLQEHKRPLVKASDTTEEMPPVLPSKNFNWKTEGRRKLRIFKPTYHITMAIKADNPSDLLTIDQGYLDRVNHRQDLIREYPDTVHGYVAGGEGPVRELYTYLLTQYLPVRFPTIFQISEDGTVFRNLATERTYPVSPPEDTRAALRNLGEIVEEEIFLLIPTPEGYRLVAYMCCFASGFDPASKLGDTLDGIHKPVPGYEKIGPSMERYFAKLEVGRPVKRANWSVQTHPELLDLHVNDRINKYAVQEPHDVKMEHTFLRSELQTLTRFPKTRAILFSFKTYMYNVSEIKQEGKGLEFADAIEGLRRGNVPDMWNYKGADKWAKSVCEYLRAKDEDEGSPR